MREATQAAVGKTSRHSANGRLVVTRVLLLLIAARDELEQQIGMAVRVGEVSDLVDDQECRVDVVAQPPSQG